MRYRMFIDAPGQMCNRFWSYIDSIGWAMQNKGLVIVPFWDKSIKHFDCLRNNPYIIFPFYSNMINRIIGEDRYLKFVKRLITNKYSKRLYRLLFRRNIEVVRSYNLHNHHVYYPKFLDDIKRIFTPNQEHRIDIDNTFSQYRENGYKIVGMHIRRGDYKYWRGGVYYYSLEEYAAFMSQIEHAFSNPKIVFYIASNEDTSELKNFTTSNICSLHGKSAPMDLYALSKCDYIAGPPSSFSRWASLMGHVPVYLIWDKAQTIDKSSFSPLKFLDEREDGLKYP